MHKKYFLLFFTLVNIFISHSLSAQFANFVTRQGDKLLDGNKQLRFISFNIPNLHYVEDYLPFDGTNPWRLPDEYEIRDALTSIKQLGGKVTRIYVLSVRRQDDIPGIIRHVEGPGKFNEEAFRTLDKVMQIANETGVRVIIPFIDNWKWWGGTAEYAAFRHKDAKEFWTDPEIIADFKETIKFLINRKNTFTGTLYRDDKALLAWETGNELQAPFLWTKEIAQFIKSQDKNHLLMEGTLNPILTPEAVEDPNIDILSTHHYGDPKVSFERITDNQKLAKGKKPYIIGEFGIVPFADIRAICDTIINQKIAGGMIWSLRSRVREGGFYGHFEYNDVEAYHWPGFTSGDFYNERLVLNTMREKAYQIDGLCTPKLPLPEKPFLFDIKNVSEISWQGSTGASSYVIERNEENTPDWQVISDNTEDSKYVHKSLFADETSVLGKRYFYRIKAKNESGTSDYSNIVGPVMVSSKKIVDEMENFDKVFQKDGEFRFLEKQDIRKAKEDRNRLSAKEGSYLIYKLPADASALVIEAFETNNESKIQVFISDSPELSDFKLLQLDKQTFKFANNDYGFYTAVRYKTNTMPEGTRFVKIVLNENIQLGRIEIAYSLKNVN